MEKPSAKSAAELVNKVLAAVSEQPTKEEQMLTAQKIEQSSKLFIKKSSYLRPTAEHQRAFETAAAFAGELNYARFPHWLTLLGPSGIGKTHLAREIYQHFMRHSRFVTGFNVLDQRLTGNTGQFCNWRSFCADVKQGSYGRIDDLCKDWFVVIDDIGSEYDPSGFIASAIDRIVHERSKDGDTKWTVITCNFYLNQIAEKIDPRVADRMIRNGSIVLESKLDSWALTH